MSALAYGGVLAKYWPAGIGIHLKGIFDGDWAERVHLGSRWGIGGSRQA